MLAVRDLSLAMMVFAIGAKVSLQLALDEKVRFNKLTEQRNAFIKMNLSRQYQCSPLKKRPSRGIRALKKVTFSESTEIANFVSYKAYAEKRSQLRRDNHIRRDLLGDREL